MIGRRQHPDLVAFAIGKNNAGVARAPRPRDSFQLGEIRRDSRT
jgi:hypothetical protein